MGAAESLLCAHQALRSSAVAAFAYPWGYLRHVPGLPFQWDIWLLCFFVQLDFGLVYIPFLKYHLVL